MKLEEAIKNNEDNKAFFEADGYLKCAAAVQLGIEALKLYQHNRHIGQHVDPNHLPGETDD